jgi:hypothetical protein
MDTLQQKLKEKYNICMYVCMYIRNKYIKFKLDQVHWNCIIKSRDFERNFYRIHIQQDLTKLYNEDLTELDNGDLTKLDSADLTELNSANISHYFCRVPVFIYYKKFVSFI